MGIFNIFFKSTKATVKEAEFDNENLLKIWNDYLTSIKEKHEIIATLTTENIKYKIDQLKTLIKTELVDIDEEEKLEKEIIKDVESIEHAEKIKRVHQLEEELSKEEVDNGYVNGILHHLFSVLKTQLHIVKNLDSDPKEPAVLINHLMKQAEIEKELVKKINDVSSFNGLLIKLLRGEKAIERLDDHEKELFSQMQFEMHQKFVLILDKETISLWTEGVFNAIEDKIHQAVLNNDLVGYSKSVKKDFVQTEKFVELVTEKLEDVTKKEILVEMIKDFVSIFRSWIEKIFP